MPSLLAENKNYFSSIFTTLEGVTQILLCLSNMWPDQKVWQVPVPVPALVQDWDRDWVWDWDHDIDQEQDKD